MSSFSEFSKGIKNDNKPNRKRPDEDIARNRIDPSTGNEREDREPTHNFHEVNDTPITRNARNSAASNGSQNRNEQRTTR